MWKNNINNVVKQIKLKISWGKSNSWSKKRKSCEKYRKLIKHFLKKRKEQVNQQIKKKEKNINKLVNKIETMKTC